MEIETMICSDTFEERDCWLFVVSRHSLNDEPILVVAWYPIGIPSRDYPEVVGAEALRAGTGEYMPDLRGWGLRFRLAEGGQTLPEHFEKEPIPCPKTRKGIDTRYHYGQWEKYLKSRGGWVAA
jgi:hypothetical protein